MKDRINITPQLLAGSLLVGLTGCGTPDDIPKGYNVPTCAESQYFDGVAAACTDKVTALAFPAAFMSGDQNLALRNTPFDQHTSNIENFITAYTSTHLSGYTLTTAPSCSRVLERQALYNQGYYNGNFAINCSLVLAKDGTEVLNFNTDQAVAGHQYLKVLQNPLTNEATVKYCTVAETTHTTYTVAETELTIDTKAAITTTDLCADFGSTYFVPEVLRASEPAVQAIGRTLYSYVAGTQTANDLTTGTSMLNYATATTAKITSLPLTCDSVSLPITVSLTSDITTPMLGTLTISNFDYDAFFTKTEVTAGDNVYYQQRSLFGCNDKTCVENLQASGGLSYRYFGNNLVVADTDVWSIATDATTGAVTLAYNPNTSTSSDQVCEFVYNAKKGNN